MEQGLSRAGTWTWHPDDVVKAHKMPTGAKQLPKSCTRLTFTTNLPPIAPEKRLRLLLEQDDELSRTTSWRTSAEHGKTGSELQNRREGRQNSVHGHQRSILLQSDRFLECGLPNASTMAADTEWPATSTSLNEPAK